MATKKVKFKVQNQNKKNQRMRKVKTKKIDELKPKLIRRKAD